jgi:quercetin dioxygenase-like cupin family protein
MFNRMRAFVLAGGVLVGAAVSARAVAADAVRAPAHAPAPYVVKSAASLAEVEKTLQGHGGHSADLVKPGATGVEIVWRHEEDHESKDLEVHDGKDHVFFVTDGQATFTLGGELVDPREISAGEWRAPVSRKSDTVEAHKGDLIFIPHGTVHGRSAKGQRFTMLQISFWPGGPPAATVAAATPPAMPALVPKPAPPATKHETK